MKKLILLSAIFSLLTAKAMAQESVPSSTGSTTPPSQESSNSTQTKKEKREQRYEKASPEQKAKMDQRREENKGLSKEERKGKREENRGESQGKKDSSNNEVGYKNQPYGNADGRGMGGNVRYANASPEQREEIEKRREAMKNLSPEKKELVKKEMDRHRAEMKKITGFDLPMPINPNGPNNK